MACMTPAAEGTRISIDDPEALAFRAAVIECLMLNHPHDCPVCDEGGECHLQDMTVMTGHDYRRYEFDKRTFRNQNLGPLVNHEMNRCIQCYRCVRYYRDYAGGRDLNAFALRNTVFFGRHEDGALENRVQRQSCGDLPDRRVHRQDPEAALHAQVGSADRAVGVRALRPWVQHRCRASATARCGASVNRYNHEVNGYFLCDRGRFGYEFVNRDRRIREPMLKGNGG